MLLLVDIGNTHTHLGLANAARVVRSAQFPTRAWFEGRGEAALKRFAGRATIEGLAVCSVVPRATPCVRRAARSLWGAAVRELNGTTLQGLGLDYPRPQTIGPDRLANALAAFHRHGAPVVAVDFGTAVTFDVVDRRGKFVGGVIAPGLAALAGYLHEKTALLPRIQTFRARRAIGRCTEESIRIGVGLGYQGLVRELLRAVKCELRCRRVPVVATGGYAQIMADRLPEITVVEPKLTLEGLRLFWLRAGP
jgi:type III pantothenate kinase